MIPHSIKRAAAPVTNGVAIDVPDKLFSPPQAFGMIDVVGILCIVGAVTALTVVDA